MQFKVGEDHVKGERALFKRMGHVFWWAGLRKRQHNKRKYKKAIVINTIVKNAIVISKIVKVAITYLKKKYKYKKIIW